MALTFRTFEAEKITRLDEYKNRHGQGFRLILASTGNLSLAKQQHKSWVSGAVSPYLNPTSTSHECSFGQFTSFSPFSFLFQYSQHLHDNCHYHSLHHCHDLHCCHCTPFFSSFLPSSYKPGVDKRAQAKVKTEYSKGFLFRWNNAGATVIAMQFRTCSSKISWNGSFPITAAFCRSIVVSASRFRTYEPRKQHLPLYFLQPCLTINNGD